jgi:hypothetical protein
MDLITILYSFSGLVFGFAFFPQIATLVKDKSGAASMSLSTWAIFTACSIITFLYACTHGDKQFIFCSAIGTAGNVSILIIGAVRRMQYNLSVKRAAQIAVTEY